MCVCPTAVERKLHLGVPKEVWKDQDVYIKKEHSGGVNDLFVLLCFIVLLFSSCVKGNSMESNFFDPARIEEIFIHFRVLQDEVRYNY